MADDRASEYLRDLGGLVVEIALKAKIEYDAGKTSVDAPYLLSRLMALHEVASLMQQQASVFGLPLEDLSLHTLNPDKDLS